MSVDLSAESYRGRAGSVDVILDERKMYMVEWRDGAAFGFTVTPVGSDRGTVLLLARRTARRQQLEAAGLQDVVPGDLLVAIGDEKVYHLGADNATRYLRSVRKPVRLTLQLSPYGNTAKSLPDLAPNEYHYLWESGPLGLVLTQDLKSKLPMIKRISDKANDIVRQHCEVEDQLIYANDVPASEYSMDELMSILREMPKPILMRFRKRLKNDHLVELPHLSDDEYEFLWDYGPLGLVIGMSREGLPFVRSFTGLGTSKQLGIVQENDEIIMVNDRNTMEIGFKETMTYLMNVPKPAVLRFRRKSRRGGERRDSQTPQASLGDAPSAPLVPVAPIRVKEPIGPIPAVDTAVGSDCRSQSEKSRQSTGSRASTVRNSGSDRDVRSPVNNPDSASPALAVGAVAATTVSPISAAADTGVTPNAESAAALQSSPVQSNPVTPHMRPMTDRYSVFSIGDDSHDWTNPPSSPVARISLRLSESSTTASPARLPRQSRARGSVDSSDDDEHPTAFPTISEDPSSPASEGPSSPATPHTTSHASVIPVTAEVSRTSIGSRSSSSRMINSDTTASLSVSTVASVQDQARQSETTATRNQPSYEDTAELVAASVPVTKNDAVKPVASAVPRQGYTGTAEHVADSQQRNGVSQSNNQYMDTADLIAVPPPEEEKENRSTNQYEDTAELVAQVPSPGKSATRVPKPIVDTAELVAESPTKAERRPVDNQYEDTAELVAEPTKKPVVDTAELVADQLKKPTTPAPPSALTHKTSSIESLVEVFTIDESAFFSVKWTDGPFGSTVREADSNMGPVMLITKRTGKQTCAGLRRIQVGDLLVRIGDRDVYSLGFEKATRYLRKVPKPVTLTFQVIE